MATASPNGSFVLSGRLKLAVGHTRPAATDPLAPTLTVTIDAADQTLTIDGQTVEVDADLVRDPAAEPVEQRACIDER